MDKPKFKQIGKERIQPNLVKHLAELKLEPSDLSRDYGLRFEEAEEEDGLGPLLWAAIELDNGKQFVFVRYLLFAGGTLILVQESSNLSEDVPLLLSLMGLTADELRWAYSSAS